MIPPQDLTDFMEKVEENRFDIYLSRILKEESTDFDRQYVFHTAWAARVLAQLCPEKHVDISSLIYFNALVSAFIPIDFYEYRPVQLDTLKDLQAQSADLMKLPFSDNSIPSLSCMHVVEHIGLGRYGDDINPDGDLRAIEELKRVSSGDLLFVVPVGGRPKVIFNLHRIYSYDQIVSYFKGFKLMEFALVTDAGGFINDATKKLADKQSYGCGCFWFRKD
jgi:hypothetical protein